MDQDASSKPEIPRSALLAVNRALTTIHSALGLRPTLEAIAHGVTVSTPYQDVAVTIAEERNAAELRVIAVIGPPDAVALLLNTTCRRTALLEHLAGGEAWGSLRFLAAAESADASIERVEQLAELHKSGVLTDEEFAAAKAKALGIA